MPRPLAALTIFPIAASICCCGCCDAWDWLIDLLNPGRERALAAGVTWLKQDSAARRSFGGVRGAEQQCLGAFAWSTAAGLAYWEIEYDVDGEKEDGVATLQIVEQRGRWRVAGATLVGAAGLIEVGEKLEPDSSSGGSGGDWDD